MAEKVNSELATRLVEAQRHAQAVAKDSTNAFHRYKYASAEALIEEARAALSKAGLALMATDWTFQPGATTDPNVPGVAGSMHVKYLLLAGEERLELSAETAVVVEKGRPLDKAQATALTYNLGYFLRGLLLLPREDAEDGVDARDDRRNHRRDDDAGPEPTPRPAPPQAPPPRSREEQQKSHHQLRVMLTTAKKGDDLEVVWGHIVQAKKDGWLAKDDYEDLVDYGKQMRAKLTAAQKPKPKEEPPADDLPF